MGGAAAGHLPVMVEEVLDLFAPALQPTGAILVDATLGRAGHARALLDAHPGLVLIGVDTDRQHQLVGEADRAPHHIEVAKRDRIERSGK